MNYQETCQSCGHQKTAYTHKLNVSQVKALRKLVDLYEQNGKGIDMKSMGLTNSQYTNFNRLSYFDLAVCNQGKWYPTKKGVDFIYGMTSIFMPVAVMEGIVLPFNHEAWKTNKETPGACAVKDIDEVSYKKKPEYSAEKQNTLL